MTQYVNFQNGNAPRARRPMHDPNTGVRLYSGATMGCDSHLNMSRSFPNSAAAKALQRTVGISAYAYGNSPNAGNGRRREDGERSILQYKLYVRCATEEEAQQLEADLMAAQNDGLLVMMAPTPIVYAGFEETVDEDGVIGFRVAVDEERSRFWRHTRNRVFPRRNQVNEDGTPVYGVEMVYNLSRDAIRFWAIEPRVARGDSIDDTVGGYIGDEAAGALHAAVAADESEETCEV